LGFEDHQALIKGLVESHGQQLWRYLLTADVPDIVQEAFLRIMRVPNVESVRSPEAYLFTVGRRHSSMDPHRVGVTGHSWGGYFSTCALIEAPDTYHAAVSYAPGYDPWDANIYEPYLGLPDKNRLVYEKVEHEFVIVPHRLTRAGVAIHARRAFLREI